MNELHGEVNTNNNAAGISATPHEDNLRYFDVIITGPDSSPYQGTFDIFVAGFDLPRKQEEFLNWNCFFRKTTLCAHLKCVS